MFYTIRYPLYPCLLNESSALTSAKEEKNYMEKINVYRSWYIPETIRRCPIYLFRRCPDSSKNTRVRFPSRPRELLTHIQYLNFKLCAFFSRALCLYHWFSEKKYSFKFEIFTRLLILYYSLLQYTQRILRIFDNIRSYYGFEPVRQWNVISQIISLRSQSLFIFSRENFHHLQRGTKGEKVEENETEKARQKVPKVYDSNTVRP
mgnify:CR=1 FL=1